MIQSIDHIGIAVKSLHDALPLYTDGLGMEEIVIEDVPSQKVRVAMIPVGNSRIELLEPTSPDSPIAKFIEKHGEGIHHISLEVTDIEQHMAQLKDNNIQLTNDTPVPGADGTIVTFLHPKSTHGVLIELSQEET